MAQKLKFGNGTWATKKGSTLSYNDEGGNFKPLPFATTRNSIGTRVNKEGLIEVVGSGVPRIDYTDSADGVLLLENSATNYVHYSESIDSWATGFSSLSPNAVTADYEQGPYSNTSADRVQLTINPSNTVSQVYQVLAITSGAYTASVWLKSLSGTPTVAIIDNYNTSGGFKLVTLTNEWVRHTLTFTATANEFIPQFLLLNGTTSSSADFLAYGFQVEQGSYPTSYIPTSGSTVQRAADTASGAGNSAVFNSEQGVLFANILPSTFTDVAPNFYKFISLSDGTPTNRLLLGITSSSKLSITMVTSGGNTAFTEKTISQQNLKVAINWDANYLTAYLNGFQYSTPLSVVSNFAANSLKSLNFNTPTSYPFYGKTKEIGYYDTALTDLELEYMTSYRTLNELVTELNLNTL